MIVKYQILPKRNLVVLQFIGDWSTLVLKAFAEKLITEPNFSFVEKILIDFRKVNLEPAIKAIQELIDFRKNVLPKKHTIVHLVDSPISTAGSHLYQEGLKQMGFKCSYCSTIKQALIFFGLDITTVEMEIFLKSLKYQFV